MWKMKKNILLLSIIAMSGCLLTGCGGKKQNQETGDKDPTTSENNTGNEASGTDKSEGEMDSDGETETGEEVPAELVFENFSSGVIYEDGKYLFQIDSMEMTEEAYVITYRSSTDTQGYQPYYDMNVTVNGVGFASDDFIHISGDQKDYYMMGTGPDATAQLILNKQLLAAVGITEISALEFNVALGHGGSGSVYEDVMFTASVYPGAKVDTADWFPDPQSADWVLVDDERGKAQITSIQYLRNNSDNSIAGFTVYILGQGAGDTHVSVDSITAGDWVTEESDGDSCWMNPEKRYAKVWVTAEDSVTDEHDFSQSTVTFSLWTNGANDGEGSVTLDLNGLGDALKYTPL